MRKTCLIGTLLLFALTLSSTAESIDGRMIVAGAGELPEGLFVKAAGYLPGDTIFLTNTSTGKKVGLLNLGTLDPSTGVAMLLSPESAESLGVSSNENMQVQLSQRSEVYDSVVQGEALLSVPEKKKEPPVAIAKSEEPDYDEGDYSYDDFDDGSDFLSYKKNIEQPSPADEIPVVAKNDSETPSESESVSEPSVEPVAYEKFDADEIPVHSSLADSLAEEVPATEPEVPSSEPVAELVNDHVSDSSEPVSDGTSFSFEPVGHDDLLAFSPLREEPLIQENTRDVTPDSESLYELVNDAEPPFELPSEEEPVADFSHEDERSWEAEPGVDESRAVQGENEGERVASVEPVEKEPEVVSEPEPEKIDEPLEEPPVPEIDEGRSVLADNDGENVASVEPAPRKVEPVAGIEPEPSVPEIDENRKVSADNAGEEVSSVEPKLPELSEPLAEALSEREPSLSEKDGEEVIAAEPKEENVPEPSVPEVDEKRPVLSDNAGEEVASVEPAPKEHSLEEQSGEDVSSTEPSVPEIDESRPVAFDNEGEDVEGTEPVFAPEVTDEPSVVEVNEGEEGYGPIVLIPTDEKVPGEEEPLEITPVPVKEEEPLENAAPAKESLASHVVSSESELPSGYYVQIATMESEEALESLLSTYYKYPIVLVRTRGGSYRVLIGKLTEDEYGAVLAKFKAFGFKDAFLRNLR